LIKKIVEFRFLPLLLCFLFISSIIPMSVSAEEPQILPNITYKSTITLDFDTSILDKPIEIGEKATLPITVTYSTDLQKDSYKIIPEKLLYRFYFGTTEVPQQTIQLIVEKVSNTNINLDRDEITFTVPFDENTYTTIVNLTISPTSNAIAQSFATKITASCSSLYRLNGTSIEQWISFTPAYYPCATITENISMMLGSSEINSTTVTINNCGNGEIRVTPKLVTDYKNITVIISPKYLDIGRDSSDYFDISIFAGSSFEGIKPLDFNFTIERHPSSSYDKIIYKNFTIDCEFQKSDEGNLLLNPFLIIIIFLIISNIIFIGKYKRYW